VLHVKRRQVESWRVDDMVDAFSTTPWHIPHPLACTDE
jgi:hypothetical protein